jgi:hypothetical protein
VVAVLATLVYAAGPLAWPFAIGQDGTYYLDLASAKPVFPLLMLYRTPGASLFFGPLLDLGGGPLAEVAMGPSAQAEGGVRRLTLYTAPHNTRPRASGWPNAQW